VALMAPYPDRKPLDRIAGRASYKEIAVQRALGADWTTAYLMGWAVMDEIYDLAAQPDRPAVHEAARTITGKGEAW
jgi:hypothetical protein